MTKGPLKRLASHRQTACGTGRISVRGTKALASGFPFIPVRFTEARREGGGGDARRLTGRASALQRTADGAGENTQGLR